MALVRAKNKNHITLCSVTLVSGSGEISSDGSYLLREEVGLVLAVCTLWLNNGSFCLEFNQSCDVVFVVIWVTVFSMHLNQ